jgi:NADH-quinone oxidoreductase E subunit
MMSKDVVQHIDPVDDPILCAKIDEIIAKHKEIKGAPMVVLNELQNEIGYITENMQEYVAEKLEVPVSLIHGVVTFYSFFATRPRGKYTIKFCLGTACYVRGVDQLIDKARQILGIDLGETTEDGMITLETCRCVGACSQAPVIMVEEDVYGQVQAKKLEKIIKQYQNT